MRALIPSVHLYQALVVGVIFLTGAASANDAGMYLGAGKIRAEDLTAASSRLEKTVASPDDDTLKIWFTISGTILSLYSVWICIVFCSIIASKKARGTPFNQYILWLTFPDFIYTFPCAITCIMSAMKGDYYSVPMCYFQSWYIVFGTAANVWLNALISNEVHRLLKACRDCKRYVPPSRQSVWIRTICAYGIAAFLGCITLIRSPNYPMEVAPNYGFVCIPTQDGVADILFFYLFFIPLFMVIPVGYIFWVMYDVLYRSKLLPKGGKRRDIAIYFFRITFVFIVFWLPTLLIFYIVPNSNIWLRFVMGVFSHGQGAVSAGVCLMKSDIKEAFVDFISCKWHKTNEQYEEDQQRNSALGRFSSTVSSLVRSGVKLFKMQENEPQYPYDLPRQREDFQFEDEVDGSETERMTASFGPISNVILEIGSSRMKPISESTRMISISESVLENGHTSAEKQDEAEKFESES